MFPLLLSCGSPIWRAKCTFGYRLSQWPSGPTVDGHAGRKSAGNWRRKRVTRLSRPTLLAVAQLATQGGRHAGIDPARIDNSSGAPRRRQTPFLKVSLCEAPVGQSNDRHQPGDDPSEVDPGQGRTGEERIPGPRPPGDPSSSEDFRRLE